MLDEAGLQHLRRRLARLAPVGEPLDLSSLRVIDLGHSISLTFTDLFIEPVDDVAADEGVLDGDLEPQPVAHLQPRVCEGHQAHLSTDVKCQNVLKSCLAWPLHRAHNGAHPRVGVELVGGDGRGRSLVGRPACRAAVWIINCCGEMGYYDSL